MLFSDFKELIEPVDEPQSDSSVSTSTPITHPATADYCVVWCTGKAIDVLHLPKDSTTSAVAGTGISISPGFDNAHIFRIHNSKIVGIEAEASATMRWQHFRKASHVNG